MKERPKTKYFVKLPLEEDPAEIVAKNAKWLSGGIVVHAIRGGKYSSWWKVVRRGGRVVPEKVFPV